MNHIVQGTFNIDRNFETFIATGNVPLSTGQGLPQTSGMKHTIVAESCLCCVLN